MSKEECLHDCTCDAHGFLSEDPDSDSWFECDLPQEHLGPHWSAERGYIGKPVV